MTLPNRGLSFPCYDRPPESFSTEPVFGELTPVTHSIGNRKTTLGTLLVAIALLAFGKPADAKRKDDMVAMKNGDRLTGEIKRLDHGILYFKSNYMLESVQLDWAQVDRLESKDSFLVVLQNGKRYMGQIAKIAGKETAAPTVQLDTEGGALKVAQAEVISIQQKEGNFRSQLNGSIDNGLSYASGSSTLSSALEAAVEYRRTNDFVAVATSSQFSTQSNGPSTNRFTLDGQYFRSLSPNWFYGGLVDFLKSDQQELNLRTTLGGALGRTMIRTGRTSFRLFGGTVYSRERYFPEPNTNPLRQNAEGLVGATFNTFRFKVLDIGSSLLVYPGFTDAGRVRVSSDSNIHIELIKDFYWGYHLYENYDSRPPVQAPRNDLGVTTGFGWKF
jgi:putative salt-induced outer membrane protein YdiY